MKPETKSKRFNALLKLSNYEQAKSKAGDLGISINEYINRLIEQDA